MRRKIKGNAKGKLMGTFILSAVLGLSWMSRFDGFGSYVPVGQAKSVDVRERRLMPVGVAVGIHIQTKGLLVLGTAEVTDGGGNVVSPSENAVTEGDYIISVNGKAVNTAAQMTEAIRLKKDEALELVVLRDGEERKTSVKPVKTKDGDYKTGIWVRDDTQGIGTLSFVDENNHFAALGHGITDVDTGGLVDMSAGGLYPSSVYALVKGKNGNPGEMVGNIIYGKSRQFGVVYKNTDAGIYGRLISEKYAYDEKKALPAGEKSELKVGDAVMLCQLHGKTDTYHIKIIGIDYNSRGGNKDFVVQITDERLLQTTGGIIQGMSGSPIIQNGKLVGAVTHVFVNDPTKGYGIFIEDMLEY